MTEPAMTAARSHYFTRAAENAHRVYANEEAHTHYTRAIEVAERVSADAVSRWPGYTAGVAWPAKRWAISSGRCADHEAIAADRPRRPGESVERLEWRALLDLGKLWASRDYDRAHDYFRASTGPGPPDG